MANPEMADAIRVRMGDIRAATYPDGAPASLVDPDEGMRLGEKRIVVRDRARTAMVKALRKGDAAEATYLAVEIATDDIAANDSSAVRDGSGAWLWPGRTSAVRRRIVDKANEMLAAVRL